MFIGKMVDFIQRNAASIFVVYLLFINLHLQLDQLY